MEDVETVWERNRTNELGKINTKATKFKRHWEQRRETLTKKGAGGVLVQKVLLLGRQKSEIEFLTRIKWESATEAEHN